MCDWPGFKLVEKSLPTLCGQLFCAKTPKLLFSTDYETEQNGFEAKVADIRARLGANYQRLGAPIATDSLRGGRELQTFHLNVYTLKDPMNSPELVSIPNDPASWRSCKYAAW